MKLLKPLSLAFALSYYSAAIFAQAKPVSTTIEKENRNAVMIEISQPVGITTDALEQKLKRAGLNEKIRNGTANYKGVVLSEISSDKVDIYTKIEQGPNNTSVVYMAVSKGYNNFTNAAADSSVTINVEAFLNSFVKDANNYSADVGIGNQLKVENKSQNEYQKLLDEQKDLEKKKAKIDIRLIEIQNELNTRKIDLDKQKAAVEDSKAKRVSDNNQ